MYLGDDIDEVGDDADQDRARRLDMLQKLQKGNKTLSVMVPVLLCGTASEQKDPEHFDPVVFKSTLDTALEAGQNLPLHFVAKYAARQCASSMKAAVQQIEELWTSFSIEPDAEPIIPAVIFDEWSVLLPTLMFLVSVSVSFQFRSVSVWF